MTLVNFLQDTALAEFVSRSLWAYPFLESVHLIGLAFVVGAVAMLDLRLIGLSRALPIRGLAAHILPWVRFAFILVTISGILLYISDAEYYTFKVVFWVKIGLIVIAGLNAFLFHRGIYNEVDNWNENNKAPARVRVTGAVSLFVWMGVIVAGRLLAYI